MADRDAAQELLDSLQGSLDLLAEYRSERVDPDSLSTDPLPSLLDQCVALAAQAPADTPMRTIHHMACTGGTLISKALSAMPNVTLLSEIDPLSRMGLPHRHAIPPFRPSDMIYAGRVALRPIDDAVARRVALAALEEMRQALAEQGRVLCIRDHAHSQYCTRTDPRSRPSLHAMLAAAGPVRSVVTVRHPLDSFLSLMRNGWVNFRPDTIDEYATRYTLFLDDHADLQVFRYEDFVTAPEAELERICAALGLAFQPGVEALLPAIHLSGDSGRSSSTGIAPRPRRAVPDTLARDASESPAYAQLCGRLGFDP